MKARRKRAHLGELTVGEKVYVFQFNPGPGRVEWWVKGTRSRRHIRTVDLRELVDMGDGQGLLLRSGDFTRAIKAAY